MNTVTLDKKTIVALHELVTAHGVEEVKLAATKPGPKPKFTPKRKPRRNLNVKQ